MQYEYKCCKCGKVILVYTNDYNLKHIICEKCGSRAEKIISKSSYRWRFNDK